MAKNEQLKIAIEKIKINTGLKQAEIANKLDIKSTYLSDMINGRVPLTESVCQKISELFHISILEDKLEDFSFKESTKSNEQTYYNNDNSEYINYIPLLPISAQAGSLNDFMVSVKDSECERVVSPVKGSDFAITVAGDSMSPEYPSGSQIFIKKINENAFIDWGKVYVLDTCNGTVIKRIFPAEDNNPRKVRCVSINPEYPSFEVSLDNVFGIYRVLLCMSVK